MAKKQFRHYPQLRSCPPKTSNVAALFGETEKSMNKRGRPKKNGQVPPWMLERVTVVLYAYERARAAGAKHLTAVQEAVGFVRANRPLMPISETAVKRILAEWRSNRSRSCLFVTKPDPAPWGRNPVYRHLKSSSTSGDPTEEEIHIAPSKFQRRPR